MCDTLISRVNGGGGRRVGAVGVTGGRVRSFVFLHLAADNRHDNRLDWLVSI